MWFHSMVQGTRSQQQERSQQQLSQLSYDQEGGKKNEIEDKHADSGS